METVRPLAAWYFILQGCIIALWWCVLLLEPESRELFRMGSSDTALLSFWASDILLAGSSLLGGILLFRRTALAPFILWLVAGSAGGGTLYTLAFAVYSDSGWLGVAMMLPAMILSFAFAIALTPVHPFRKARPATPLYNTGKTALQIVILWSVLLLVLPRLIVDLETRSGFGQLAFPAQEEMGIILFLLCSAVGLWSGVTIARHGGGTPLPLDSTTRLVIGGPYAYLRNPMAIAGLGQGVAVAIALGSPFVLIYVALGSFLWQYIARPLEEDDLLRHFGQHYECYRKDVRCWVPRRHRYRGGE